MFSLGKNHQSCLLDQTKQIYRSLYDWVLENMFKFRNVQTFYKKYSTIKESIKEGIKKLPNLQNYLSTINLLVSLIGGFIGWTIYTRRETKKILRDFPQPSLLYVQRLFEMEQRFKLKNEIYNEDIEKTLKYAIERAQNHLGIYMVLGEHGIGKTTALEKVLNVSKVDFIYFSFQYAICELSKYLVPETKNKTKEYPFYDILTDSLFLYGRNKDKNYHLISNPLPGNSLVILDNVSVLPENEIKELLVLAKKIIDERVPITFIFITNDQFGTNFLYKNISRMNVIELNEPSPRVAYDFFQKAKMDPMLFNDVEEITGSLFKYLLDTKLVQFNSKEQYLNDLKTIVHSRMSETNKWLKNDKIVDICKIILKNGSINVLDFENTVGNTNENPLVRDEHWSTETFKETFKILNHSITFKNRAIENYIKERIKNGI